MDFTYPKHEKLKSRKTIDLLFSEGKSVARFPLRLAFVKVLEEESEGKIKFGVSVSKKYFKKATDRNYFKRLLRESYRLNKHLLTELNSPYAFMLLYQTKEKLPFSDINLKTQQLFAKFLAGLDDSAANS